MIIIFKSFEKLPNGRFYLLLLWELELVAMDENLGHKLRFNARKKFLVAGNGLLVK